MDVEITQKFRKQVNRLADKKLKRKIHDLIVRLGKAENISAIKGLKKLKGHKLYYRIRLGDYRIGISIEKEKIILAAIDHRSDIYKYFP